MRRYKCSGVGVGLSSECAGKNCGCLAAGRANVVLLQYILDEMVRVLPKLTMTSVEIRDLADSFLFLAEIVEPSREVDEALRD